MYSSVKSTETDLNNIKKAMAELPIYTGIFENFELSLAYFQDKIGIEWSKKVEAKRITFKRPSKEEITPELRALIIEKNGLDMELYNHAKTIFDQETIDLKPTKIKFIKDKYNHVVPYCMKWCFFEFCVENKSFLKTNREYFKTLTFYLINDLNIRDGIKYTKTWNQTFLNTIKSAGLTDFHSFLSSEYNLKEDPLENLYKLGENIDLYLENNKTPLLNFKKEDVEIPKSKLFGLF